MTFIVAGGVLGLVVGVAVGGTVGYKVGTWATWHWLSAYTQRQAQLEPGAM